jgi:hypothetical protein
LAEVDNRNLWLRANGRHKLAQFDWQLAAVGRGVCDGHVPTLKTGENRRKLRPS